MHCIHRSVTFPAQRCFFQESCPKTGSDQRQSLPMPREHPPPPVDEHTLDKGLSPGTSEEEVTAPWADTSPQLEGLERGCRIHTDAISLAPTAVGNSTGYFLLSADSRNIGRLRGLAPFPPLEQAGRRRLLGQRALTRETGL